MPATGHGRKEEVTITRALIDGLTASAYSVPTDAPYEADGTYEWSDTTLVVAAVQSNGESGYGWTYSSTAAAMIIADLLAPQVIGRDGADNAGTFGRMARAARNVGRTGVVSSAIAAIDIALWDLKARLLDTSVVKMLGRVRDGVDAYGSGGFTSYSHAQLEAQLGGWADAGLRMVKMKVGADPSADEARVDTARKAVGDDVELFVDANGAYSRKQALWFASLFAERGVSWFEEPVSSDDLDGLRLMRDRAPAGMDIAAGEYGWTTFDHDRMLRAGAVDVLQIDATRCGGFTGFLRSAALCDAAPLPCSAHTSPTSHAHVCCCVPSARHVEYFHDHARIESLFFDGALTPSDGRLAPDADAPGLGISPRWEVMDEYLVWRSE